jgi:hypothetical protein
MDRAIRPVGAPQQPRFSPLCATYPGLRRLRRIGNSRQVRDPTDPSVSPFGKGQLESFVQYGPRIVRPPRLGRHAASRSGRFVLGHCPGPATMTSLGLGSCWTHMASCDAGEQTIRPCLSVAARQRSSGSGPAVAARQSTTRRPDRGALHSGRGPANEDHLGGRSSREPCACGRRSSAWASPVTQADNCSSPR